MQEEEMVQVVKQALKGLVKAVEELQKPTTPDVPMPRPRVFKLAPGVEWPKCSRSVEWYQVKGGSWLSQTLAVEIVQRCGRQPRRVLRAVRRIQAATAWCEARTRGRQRQAAEILRQQRAAVEALEAEAAVGKLG